MRTKHHVLLILSIVLVVVAQIKLSATASSQAIKEESLREISEQTKSNGELMTIDFEMAPGPDGVLGTNDDVTLDEQTVIDDEFSVLGVHFSLVQGESPLIATEGYPQAAFRSGNGYPDIPASSGINTLTDGTNRSRDIAAAFTEPVSVVQLILIDFRADSWSGGAALPGRTVDLNAYDENGDLLAVDSYTTTGSEPIAFLLPLEVTANGIKRVELAGTTVDQGIAIDDFSFTCLNKCSSRLPSISGNIELFGGEPLPGVAVHTQDGRKAVTSSSGFYSFANLSMSNTYTITPKLSDHIFNPTHIYSMSPPAINKNFTGLEVPDPFLNLPFDFALRGTGHPYEWGAFRAQFIARTNAIFDHRKPLNYNDNWILPYLGYPLISDPSPFWYPRSELNLDCGLTDEYGNLDCYDGHEGYDFSRVRGVGENIYPAAPGEVIFAGFLSGYGETVKIDHLNGFTTLYGHMRPSSISVVVGNLVTINTPIGQIGKSGFATGPHIHFGLYFGDTLLDPSGWRSDQEDPLSGQPDNLWRFDVPERERWVIDGQTGGTVTSVSGTTSIIIPSGSFPGIVDFTLTDVPVSQHSATLRPTGHSFTLQATSSSPVTKPDEVKTTASASITTTNSLTLTVYYNENEVDGLDESTLNIYWWDESSESWQSTPTTLDMSENLAVTESNKLGLFALFADDPDLKGPSIGTPVYSHTVASNLWMTITVGISDTLRGDHGVDSATVFLGIVTPYNQVVVNGIGPEGSADGVWSFAVPPQGQSQGEATLKFYIEASDGDLSPATSVNNNNTDYFVVEVVGSQYKIFVPGVFRGR